MALPVLASPEFMTEIPSTKQKIKFRPFLVKEEKILYMALEGNDEKEIQNAIVTILSNCIIDEDVDVLRLTTFDIEFLFLQLRGKSVGEKVELLMSHSEGKCEHKTQVEINLDDIKIVGEISDGKIMLDDSIGVKMRYPYMHDVEKLSGDDTMSLFNSLAPLIEFVYDKENVYNDFSHDEMVTWLEQLSQSQFKVLTDFLSNMPKLSHEVKWKCSKCGETDSMVLEGLQSFFT